MIHRIEFKDRNNVISCYLPDGSAPDKHAVEELYQMTGLEAATIFWRCRELRRFTTDRPGLPGI